LKKRKNKPLFIIGKNNKSACFMGLNIKQLRKKPKVFSYITGISVEEFDQIIEKVRPIWHKKIEKPKKVAGRSYGLKSLEGHVLCLLIYYRTYLTQDFLRFMFGVHDTCISRSNRRIAKVLAPVLGIQKKRLVPEQEAKDLLIDSTEHPIDRPEKNQGPPLHPEDTAYVDSGYQGLQQDHLL